MKLGIMQPYFFPYLGYWQLMNEVDTYVIFDDVAFIKKGWIHRNQIKGPDGPVRIGIQLQDVSQNKMINELTLFHDEKEEGKLLKTIAQNYKNAPRFAEVMDLVERILKCGEDNLSGFLTYEIKEVASFIGMNTRFLLSSEIEKDNSLKAQEKILDICRRLNADTYINAIGGQELYDWERFRQQGIKLKFLQMDKDIVYPQGKGAFIPCLSIIDVLMYNEPERVRNLLTRFSLHE